MGLKPLEFSECLLDSPYFRDSIYDHEKELDETNDAIKSLIKECRNLIKALENLTKAQSSFSAMLYRFRIRYIGEVDNDDDHEYEDSFPYFSSIIEKVEEERERMLNHAYIQLIAPLERFRKEQIGSAKDEKKKFDKETERICALLETHTKINPKKKDTILQEADALLDHELRNFREMSLDYVYKLQEVNEKKKFEFVEIMLAFIYGQATFYHNGHDVFCDSRSYLTDLQYKLQRTRENFDITRQEAENLKAKTTRRFNNGELHKKEGYARQGYLFVHDKKKSTFGSGFTSGWMKHYCSYMKENKILTMIPYAQTHGKLNANTDTIIVASCIRKSNEGIDRRFQFDIFSKDADNKEARTITLQSLSEADLKQWLEVMDGKEPIYLESLELQMQNEGVTNITETGLEFAHKCMEAVEHRGLDDQGLYRIAGVSSKFNKLLQTGLDPKQLEKLDLLSEDSVHDIKTITSAMKQYFRNLSEPLLTFKNHHNFLHAIKLDTHAKKISRLQELLQDLPESHYDILKRLMYHLKLVAEHSDRNLMQSSNLGVVLGPTLMRPKEETMAAIMNIKYQSVVIENIITGYDQLFIDKFDSSSTYQKASPKVSSSPKASPPSNHTTPTKEKGKYRAPEPPSKPMPKARIDSDGFGTGDVIKSSTSIESISSVKSSGSRNNIADVEVKRKPLLPPSPVSKPRLGNTNTSNSRFFTDPVPPFTSPPNTTTVTETRDAKIVGSNSNLCIRKFSVESDAKIVGSRENIFNRMFSVESTDGKQRRKSYQLALDEFAVKSTDIPSERLSSPPPIKTKPRVNSSKTRPDVPKRKEWTVKTIYNCVAENENELSFEAGEIIHNVRFSSEEGWYIGTLNGRTGLVPKNYCEKME